MGQQKTTEQLKRDGTYRADRHGSRPTTVQGVPDAPPDLPGAAQVHFDRLCSFLSGMQCLTAADADAVACAAIAAADYAELDAAIKRDGVSVMGANGELKAHPLLSQRSSAMARRVEALRQLGLTPLARNKLAKIVEQATAGAKVSARGRKKKGNVLPFGPGA